MIERLGHLLAESPIDTEIKEAILAHLDTIPAYLLVGLLDALEAERESLKIVDFEIKKFEEDREKRAEESLGDGAIITQGLAEKWAQKIVAQHTLTER